MIGLARVIDAAGVSEPMNVPISCGLRRASWNCELGVAPVVNWHSRQPEIIHQLMRQPPKVLPMGSGLCTIWRQAYSPPFPMAPSGIARDQISTTASHCN